MVGQSANQNLAFEDLLVGCLIGRVCVVGQLYLPREKWCVYVGPIFFIPFFAQSDSLEGLQDSFNVVLAA